MVWGLLGMAAEATGASAGEGHRDWELDSPGNLQPLSYGRACPLLGVWVPASPGVGWAAILGGGIQTGQGGSGFLRFLKEQELGEPSSAPRSRTLTHQWHLWPGGYCSEPPPEAPGSAHGPTWGEKLVTKASRLGGWCEELPTSYLHSEPGDLPARSLFQGTVFIWGGEGVGSSTLPSALEPPTP